MIGDLNLVDQDAPKLALLGNQAIRFELCVGFLSLKRVCDGCHQL